jgi:hypothetical protein
LSLRAIGALESGDFSLLVECCGWIFPRTISVPLLGSERVGCLYHRNRFVLAIPAVFYVFIQASRSMRFLCLSRMVIVRAIGNRIVCMSWKISTNEGTAPNAGIARWFESEHHRPGVGEFDRSAMKASTLVLALLILTGFGVACQSYHVHTVAVYGIPEAGKIRISVGGYVACPGVYFIEGGTSLDAIQSSLIGGLRVCDHCGATAKYVTVYPHEYPNEKIKLLLTNRVALQAVKLGEGDRIMYAAVHF